MDKMKKLAIVLALGFASMLSLRAGLVTGFGDIQIWAGDGASATSRAVLVLQWNINSVAYSYAWGFGWNSGAPTGRDMLQAVDAADTHLTVDYHPGQNAVFGMFYDLNQNSSSYTPGVAGLVDYGTPANTIHDTPGLAESGDLYQSGWADGFWAYSISGGNFTYYDYYASANVNYSSPGSTTYAGVTWDTAPVGDMSRELMNGSWDTFIFSDDVIGYTTPAAVQPLAAAAVPEPSTALLALLAAGVLLYARRRLLAC